jgi:hypothetical protein
MWNPTSNSVSWSSDLVKTDRSLIGLLSDPKNAILRFFPNLFDVDAKPDGVKNDDWAKHVYSVSSIVCELCSLAAPHGSSDSSFLNLMATLFNWNLPFKQSANLVQTGACRTCNCNILISKGQASYFEENNYPVLFTRLLIM